MSSKDFENIILEINMFSKMSKAPDKIGIKIKNLLLILFLNETNIKNKV